MTARLLRARPERLVVALGTLSEPYWISSFRSRGQRVRSTNPPQAQARRPIDHSRRIQVQVRPDGLCASEVRTAESTARNLSILIFDYIMDTLPTHVQGSSDAR